MKRCKSYQSLLPLYSSDELSTEEKAALEVHLADCPSCRRIVAEQTALTQQLAALPMYEPSDQLLDAMRRRLTKRLVVQPGSLQRSHRLFQPALQAAVAILLLACGFGLGRFYNRQTEPDSALLQQILSAAQPIHTTEGEIDPYISEVEKVKYDPRTGMVDIQYHTINNIVYRGHLQSPLVKQILQQAALEETNPSTRLYAMKTMQAIAVKEQELDTDLLTSIEYLLQKEQNQGVRLMALRVLKSVPVNEAIKNILVRILLYDHNMALRIQAFETLTGSPAPNDEMEMILKSVKSDTSSFIRHRAGEMLKTIETNKKKPSTERELSREG
jgi:hypothetical protein